jgi:dolichol-phosphate mannosyltransferase
MQMSMDRAGQGVRPAVSVIVPTRNERQNVLELHRRVTAALSGISFEMIIVDDSDDDTPAILTQLAARDTRVRPIHRRRGSGLATAVVVGFEQARGEVLIVMDADLQHPPELLPAMVELGQTYDLVLPSRFAQGGDSGVMTSGRRFTTRLALQVGRAALPCVRPVSDPNGGFFALRRQVVEGVRLRPLGWKILVEVLARGHYSRVVEIPYSFGKRFGESSKFSVKEQLRYVRHLVRLAPASRRHQRVTVEHPPLLVADRAEAESH